MFGKWSFLASTRHRSDKFRSATAREEAERQLRSRLSTHSRADPQQIDKRLRELDKEWDIERAIEVEAPLMIGLGALLGAVHSKKWYALSATAASMVIVHNTTGWYPLLPLFRKLGLRSQTEIETERNALRALRRDHKDVVRH